MAFARLMWVASKVDTIKRNLVIEKQNAVKISRGDKVKIGLKLKWRHFWIDAVYNLIKCCSNICSCLRGTKLHRCCYRLGHDGTCENFTFKSIVGFIGGFILTYVFFMFFVFQLNFKLSTATLMCALFGSILTIGLAFSHTVRCVVFLLLPQFFSKRGRQALLAYAFILAITGPAKNTLNNMSILSESLACGQEQLKTAVKQIIEVIKKPFYAVRDAIKTVVKTVKEIVKKIKEILLTIKRIVMAIVRVIKAALQFLGKILNFCNRELGTPFERCSRVFESAISDCNAKLGPLFSWLCSVVYLVKSVCYIVKIFDFVCVIVDFISNSVIGIVIRKIKTFVRHIRTMFYVRIKFSHSFHFQTNQSKSMAEVAEGIITELRHRSDRVLTVFDLMSCATSLFFIFIIFKTMQYRYKFLTSERFDNIYITKNFRNIDMRRAKLEKETVLPLNNRERKLYVPTRSLYLAKPERKGLSKSAIVLTIATVKLCTHMMTDYALYWMLTVIRYHARFQSKVKAPNLPGIHIQGNGLLADLLKSIVKAFQPMGAELEIDTVPCLPDPIPPDYDRYIQIVSLLVLCWILTVSEPYGLRLRQAVMCYYHPTRAKQRAVWLYNHILRSRSSFLKFARRQLRRKVRGSKDVTKVTCREYLRANIKSPWLRLCLGSDKQEACLLCGEVFREEDLAKAIRCHTPGCPGIYCEACFTDLQNLCTVCLDPIEYGDMSDISEERDSSEAEDLAKQLLEKQKRKKRRRRLCRFLKCFGGRSESESSDSDFKKRDRISSKEMQEELLEPDSDYSSDIKTDYSYTYQDEKDLSGVEEITARSSFTDTEAQRIPDYASMESYRDAGVSAPDYELPVREEESDDWSELRQRIDKLKPTPKKRPSKDTFAKAYNRLGEFLKLRLLSSSSSEEEENQLLLDESVLEATFSTPPADEEISSFYSDSRSSSEMIRPAHRAIKVPPLHLSSLDSSSDISTARRRIFRNVKYEVVKEASSSTSTSYEYSGISVRTSISTCSLSCRRMRANSFRSLPSTTHEGYSGCDRYRNHKQKVMKYYKSTRNIKSTDQPPVRKMHSNLLKFISKFFHKAPKVLPSSYNGKSTSKNIDQVSLLSPKSTVNTSSELSTNSSSSTGLDTPSCVCTSTDTSHSTLMGSTPRKHLRAGEETGTFGKREQGGVANKELLPDLDSSDSEITIVEQQNIQEELDAVPSRDTGHVREQNQMNADDGEKSPSTKRYSREPPERDESHAAMRNISNNYSAHDTHSKSDSSVLSKHKRSRPDVYFNTSLIDGPTSSQYNRDYDSATSSNVREATALQKYQPCEYAVDDEGTCSESTCPNRRRCSSPSCLEGTTHHIKHYRSRRCDKGVSNYYNCRKCKCYQCQMYPYTTDEEPTTCYSNTSLTTDFMDLPYQHNNEYLGLVHELEDTLSARNKERVRKTMREFEYLSRNNKSLEKPIFDDDEEETYCQTRQKSKNTRRRRPRSVSLGKTNKCCCQRKDCVCSFSRRVLNECDLRLSAAPPNAGYKGNVMAPKPVVGDMKSGTARCRTRWSMDQRTGEWYKVYDELEDKYSKNGSSRIPKVRSPDYHRETSAYSRHSRSERCSNSGCYCCRHGSKY